MTKIITKTCIFQIVEYNNIAPIRIMWYSKKDVVLYLKTINKHEKINSFGRSHCC